MALASSTSIFTPARASRRTAECRMQNAECRRGSRRSAHSSPAPSAPIAVPDDLQSFQGQLGVGLVDVLAVLFEQRGEAAGGHDALDARDLLFDARENAVHEAEVAEVETGLHVDHGVCANHAR